jgi:hypothetical protein
MAELIRTLDARYSLLSKIAHEPGVQDIITQLLGRLVWSFGSLASVKGEHIFDIACGSSTSKAPSRFRIHTPLGHLLLGRPRKGYTALFEPWFCRMLRELGADPVGVDIGDLEGEDFTHFRVDLGQIGALDFLPAHSFDDIQDSRLFGSPEFTAQFPGQADRLNVAREIRHQEGRLLKTNGILIHSDAEALLTYGLSKSTRNTSAF